MKKVFALLLCLITLTVLLAACDKEEPPHEHSFDSTWIYDETQHWHAAACEHTELESDRGDHVDADGDGVCDLCRDGESPFGLDDILEIVKNPIVLGGGGGVILLIIIIAIIRRIRG